MDNSKGTEDEKWMQRALNLARKGIGTTSPNPPVGAIIVKNGQVLGEGYHERAGEAHAERRAISHAREQGYGDDLKGSVLYVTLEPCTSYGRTPPCTEAILESGISKVLYGCVDPDKRHRGRADALLRAHGVQVKGRVCEEACRRLLEPWMYSVELKRPWVTAKIASTLDGRIVRKDNRWLSCEDSLKFAHQMRAESDAILLGGNTVRTDNPSLTIRKPINPLPNCKEQPWRVVLTQHRNELPKDATLFSDKYADRTLVYEDVDDLTCVLEDLYGNYGVVRLMLECGGNLLRTFLEQGLINEWVQIVTPFISGGSSMLVTGDFLTEEKSLNDVEVIPCGRDIIYRGKIT